MGVTSIRLNSEIEAPLEQLAKRYDRSRNYLINQAIREFLARQAVEDLRWADTLEALASVKKGNLVGESEVMSWLSSWGTVDESAPPKP